MAMPFHKLGFDLIDLYLQQVISLSMDRKQIPDELWQGIGLTIARKRRD